jgi:PilZ domain
VSVKTTLKPPRRVDFSFHRADARIPMEIPVVLDGHRRVPGTESTFTENVSARGARVISVRRWEPDEQLTFLSRTGEFRSSARVAYCQPVQGDGFAIGLEFIEPKGRWVVQSPR